MKHLKLYLLFSLSLLIFLTPVAHADDPNKISPDGIITDRAKIISDTTRQTVMSQQAKWNDTKAKPQVGILTVNSTDGDSIDDFANQLTQHKEWQPGSKEYDDGVLIIFAKNKGKNNVRIQTGSQTGTFLSNTAVMNILNAHKKQLKSNNQEDIDAGIRATYQDVAAKIQANQNKLTANKNNHSNKTAFILLCVVVVIVVIVVIVLILIFSNGSGGDGFLIGTLASSFGDSGDGGGFDVGGFDGGGFDGGGGSF